MWGFASPGVNVSTTLGSTVISVVTDSQGIWRQKLPPIAATQEEQTLQFSSSEGDASLSVLFGEVGGGCCWVDGYGTVTLFCFAEYGSILCR